MGAAASQPTADLTGLLELVRGGSSSEDARTVLTAKTKVFGDAQVERSQSNVRRVGRAIGQLEAALHALQATVDAVDPDSLRELWRNTDAVLEQRRAELAQPPFGAPARALMRATRRSADLLEGFKVPMRRLDDLMQQVWEASNLVDGLRVLGNRVDVALHLLEDAERTEGQHSAFFAFRQRKRANVLSRQRSQLLELQAVALDVAILLTNAQELQLPDAVADLQGAIEKAQTSLQAMEQALVRLPTLLSVLLKRLLMSADVDASDYLAQVHEHLILDRVAASQHDVATAASRMQSVLSRFVSGVGPAVPLLRSKILAVAPLAGAPSATQKMTSHCNEGGQVLGCMHCVSVTAAAQARTDDAISTPPRTRGTPPRKAFSFERKTRPLLGLRSKENRHEPPSHKNLSPAGSGKVKKGVAHQLDSGICAHSLAEAVQVLADLQSRTDELGRLEQELGHVTLELNAADTASLQQRAHGTIDEQLVLMQTSVKHSFELQARATPLSPHPAHRTTPPSATSHRTR
jgi:hypothetical protein